jgi:alpha/beta superfamily hydrolase
VVRKGEYLERAVVIPSEPPLEGLFHRGSRAPGLLIAPPHPLSGGSMESTLIAELAWAVTRAGHPTLRFNYRGVGASGGEFDEASAYDDLLKAAHHLRVSLAGQETVLPPIAALGVGMGARLVVRMSAELEVAPIVLISPDPDLELHTLRGEPVVLQKEQHLLTDLGKIVARTISLQG